MAAAMPADLFGRLSLAEDHLGKPLSRGPRMVDSREPEILGRVARERRSELAFRVDRLKRALAHGVEDYGDGCGRGKRCKLLAVTRSSGFDSGPQQSLE